MKKFFGLILIMAMILSVSVVVAADSNQTDDFTGSAVESESLQADEVSENLQVSEDSSLSAGPYNFTTLNNIINEPGRDSFTLDDDCVRQAGEGDIEINKDFTINGDNHKIDANRLGRIFKVSINANLTLNNLVLINANSNDGSVINTNGGSLEIYNCKFYNNYASNDGGVIRASGDLPTAWYNYTLASAGTIIDKNTDSEYPAINTTKATESIYPKGWTLPTTTQIGQNRNLTSFSPVLGGVYYNGTLYNESTNGYWWGSEAYSGARRYRLNYYGSSLYTNNGYRSDGRYVRCVQKLADS